ncbi:hypothetical protein SBDP1_1560001 [Syntrophobacter sp. SbD1]|nr:hypothetical protein SBDP1_1560001 [Syntrophobacter sp. SbD1]
MKRNFNTAPVIKQILRQLGCVLHTAGVCFLTLIKSALSWGCSITERSIAAMKQILNQLRRALHTVVACFLTLIEPIISWAFRIEDRGHSLKIAGINASVLAILISVTSAYYVFSQNKIHEIEVQVLTGC